MKAQSAMLNAVLTAMISKPGALKIVESGRTLTVTVSTTDMGRVLGTDGDVWKSIRHLVTFTGEARLTPMLFEDGSKAEKQAKFASNPNWNHERINRVCSAVNAGTGISVRLVSRTNESGVVEVDSRVSDRLLDAITKVLETIGLAQGTLLYIRRQGEVVDGGAAAISR